VIHLRHALSQAGEKRRIRAKAAGEAHEKRGANASNIRRESRLPAPIKFGRLFGRSNLKLLHFPELPFGRFRSFCGIAAHREMTGRGRQLVAHEAGSVV
jgi:hypothetical protein